MKYTKIAALALTAVAYGCDCSHDHGHGDGRGCGHGEAEAHSHGECRTAGHAKCEGSGGNVSVTVPKAVQEVMGLKTVRAAKRRIKSTAVLPGRYELSPSSRQTVATPVGGRISIKVKELAKVKKGDVLFQVLSPDLIARANEIETLKKRLAVYRELKISNAELDNQLAVKCAEREALLAGAEESGGVVTVSSPADGLVERLVAEDGEWLESGKASVRIVNPAQLRFKALVASPDAGKLADGMIAQVGGNSGRLSLGVGDDSGIVPVYVLFDREVAALAGERDNALCTFAASGRECLALPRECIVYVGLQPTVFVRDAHDGDRFVSVGVVPGESNGHWTAVEGLSEGCEVVKEGAYELKLALPSPDKKPAGHFHADGVFHEGEH